MAHGGVRYLEEAIRRLDPGNIACSNAPSTSAFTCCATLRSSPAPVNSLLRVSVGCDVAYFEIGLKLYDWIAGRDGLAPSRFIPRAETLRLIPTLAADRLVGSVAYTDGQFDDARFNITLVKTFAAAWRPGAELCARCGI